MGENTFVLKLNDSADIIEGIEKLAKEQEIDYGMFISASGKIKNFELVSNEPKSGLSKNRFDSEFGLQAISGKIQRNRDGKVSSNIRVSVTSRSSYTPQAGQLLSGKASGVLEIGIRKVDLKKIIEM